MGEDRTLDELVSQKRSWRGLMVIVVETSIYLLDLKYDIQWAVILKAIALGIQLISFY